MPSGRAWGAGGRHVWGEDDSDLCQTYRRYACFVAGWERRVGHILSMDEVNAVDWPGAYRVALVAGRWVII